MVYIEMDHVVMAYRPSELYGSWYNEPQLDL